MKDGLNLVLIVSTYLGEVNKGGSFDEVYQKTIFNNDGPGGHPICPFGKRTSWC